MGVFHSLPMQYLQSTHNADKAKRAISARVKYKVEIKLFSKFHYFRYSGYTTNETDAVTLVFSDR